MTSPLINITESKKTIKAQWRFLILRNYLEKLSVLKSTFIYLSGATLLLVIVFFFTGSDNYITPKIIFSILCALGWLFLLIFLLVAYVQRLRDSSIMNSYINSFGESQLNYNMRFDDEGIYIFWQQGKQTHNWQQFIAYGESKDSVYILNKQTPMHSIMWAKADIGEEIYSLLIETLRTKELPKKF